MKILAVDDTPLNLDLIVDILEANGAHVITANDGKTAVALAHTEAPDLILLDVNMPGMTGYDVCRILKQEPGTAHIPIIMLTALSDVDHRVQGLAVGADDYLTKPYSARELIARIDTRLRAKNESDNLRQMQEHVRNTFERFVNPSVVEQLLQDPSRVRLGGTLQDVTVMFTDLENFTSVSEVTSPQQLLAVLNAHHTLVVDILLAHGGTIDKFVGDSVMALFNAPLEQPDHVSRAVNAALAIAAALPDFHARFEPIYRMNINIGIHTGAAIIGNVGTPQIMNFTAVGDTVNIASRLQTFAKGGRTLVSQAIVDALKDSSIALQVEGDIRLKGRSQTVSVYSVAGRKVEQPK